MQKVTDYYINGQFQKRVVKDIKKEQDEKLEIGEILTEPTFDDVIYDDYQKEIMELVIQKMKKGTKINLLFSGHQGTGKTLSSKMLSVETSKPFVYLNGNESKQKIKKVLLNAKDGSIVLIDEIHGLRESVAEIIYPAIQDGEIYEDGVRKKLDLIFVATTTEPEKLPKPLLDRFKRIEFDELNGVKLKELLVKRMNEKMADYILNYTHNFRVINDLIETIKLYGELNEKNLVKVFRLRKINLYSGLSELQEEYIDLLKKREKPIGLRLICLYLRKSEDYIKLEVEPDLIRKEMIIITSRGRELNSQFKDYGYEELKKEEERHHPKFTKDEKQQAIKWLNDNPQIKQQFGSMYLELVNFIAEKIKEGIEPDLIDFASFGTDTSIENSYENNKFLEDL